MYSRRLKLNKKKPKPSRQKLAPGSVWGPRLALIERERALAENGGILEEDDEELYELQHELLQNIKKPPSSAGYHVMGKQSHHPNPNNGRSNEVDPVLRLGRSSSPNYFYYNYSRRTAPNASSQMRKTSCPEPSSAAKMQEQKTPSHYQHQRRASYVLGSSSGYCSGSVTTLSTCANNPNPNNNCNIEPFTKPLTLMIPSQERFDDEFDERPYPNKKRSAAGNSRQRDDGDGFGTEEFSHDSFPSSSAYRSSEDEDDDIRIMERINKKQTHAKRQFHNPMARVNPKSSGILQISTKEVVQVHAPPAQNSPLAPVEETGTEPETLELGTDEENAMKNGRKHTSDDTRNKTGSTIRALAQGVTMVYVPMQSNDNMSPRSSGNNASDKNEANGTDCDSGEDYHPDYNRSSNLPELGMHCDDCSASTNSSSRDSSKEPEDSLSSNFILKRKVSEQNPQRQNPLVMDSLLDSFESVLFKPKPGEALQKSQERCQSNNPPVFEPKGIFKRPEQPPPNPPSRDAANAKPVEKQKNLRFALENLETVLNPSRATSLEEQQYSQQHTGQHTVTSVPTPSKKTLKKVTLSLPSEDSFSTRNHELLLNMNYEELNTCSTEILSCGHVRNDDYSTLSSLTSSAQEISDFDDFGSNQGSNGHQEDVVDEVRGNYEAASPSTASGGESDAGSAASKAKPVHEPRSVLQQLRDLSRLIRGNSPTKPQVPPKTKSNKDEEQNGSSNNNNTSFYLHNDGERRSSANEDSDIAKRKTSDATDNSADSGKGSGSNTSGSSGQECSSSSAEPSPNNSRGISNIKLARNKIAGNSKLYQNSRKLKIATIRGRGGGTGGRHHYSICEDENCQQVEDSCSQQSTCSCQDCYDYRSDCTECQLYTNRTAGFQKPTNSEELCSNEKGRKKNVVVPPPPHKTNRPVVSKIVRRTSSRARASANARRTASLKRAARQKDNPRKPVILDYCDCSNCDLDCKEYDDTNDEENDDRNLRKPSNGSCCTDRNCRPIEHPSPPQPHHQPLLIPINPKGSKRGSNNKCKSRSNVKMSVVSACPSSSDRKTSTSSASSGISSSSSGGGKLSRISALRVSANALQQPAQVKPSQLLRQSDAASTGAALANNPVSVVPVGPAPGNLFTIDEANEESVYGESGSGAAAVVIGKGAKNGRQQTSSRAEFQLHTLEDELEESAHHPNNNLQKMGEYSARGSKSSQHSHPKCWLAPDATLGWSDLESLYSQNMKPDGKKSTPPALRDECPTCWKELSEMKKNCPDPNRTVDRTKRMFIWLNRRHKEFHAPWWEAKKQASMRWLVTKAFTHVVPKDKMPDPFKESKKGKPMKYSLRDEIVKGMVSGRLYCMALDSLYRSQQNNYHLSQNLTHWEIIKILSRRGIYIAQPSDMKLTEATLRQKKPIRTAAHIALIEAMMGLYAKEILGRDRIAATLRSFGRVIDPDTNSPERLVISWINTAVTTLKSYILSNAPQQLPANKLTRWLNLPEVGEIRDLCDGVGISALFALYCSNDLKIEEISVPEPGDTLTIYDSITNHSLVQKLCEDLFPEPIYHLCVTDFLYIHGCMKQNILCFLVDLFVHLEINPILRVNRLTHVPIRVEL